MGDSALAWLLRADDLASGQSVQAGDYLVSTYTIWASKWRELLCS